MCFKGDVLTEFERCSGNEGAGAIYCGTESGYLHPVYADALGEWGQPAFLPNCGGWVLQRSITNFDAVDAMGCYPLFTCQDWSSLHLDLEEIDRKWVSLVLVADPFGDYSVDYMRACFPDVMFAFKRHYVVDLSCSTRDYVSDNHARNARKALQNVTVEVCQEPAALLDDWMTLYNVLIQRHQIRGITAFSRESFARQIQVPGLVALRACAGGETVGMLLWYVMGNVAYYHLGAHSEVGYDLRASFALFWLALDYFADIGVGWLALGAGAGIHGTEDDGLSRFKRGWSTGTRVAYLCGRIFDRAMYRELVVQRANLPETSYFPLYRYGEY